MRYQDVLQLEPGHAICYSGYREGQMPGRAYPTYAQVKEDLLLLAQQWKHLRLYDCDPHAETVLEVIQQEQLNLTVMLGAYIVAERNNFGCPWGGTYPAQKLAANKAYNDARIRKLVEMANRFPGIITTLSAGNEACDDWTDHDVPVERVIHFVEQIQASAPQPVTFCENYVPWLNKLTPLAEAVDFISIHTYPVWEYKQIQEALAYTKQNYYEVAEKYPDKLVVITEAGWATHSNGRGIDPSNVSEEHQKTYYHELMNWCEKESILTFVFEAFDEPWKGSPEPLEPEKHWGLFYVDRTPKLVLQSLFPAPAHR